MGDRGAGEAQLCAALETAQAADFVAEAGGLEAVLVQGASTSPGDSGSGSLWPGP